jgi:hypothetical protein
VLLSVLALPAGAQASGQFSASIQLNPSSTQASTEASPQNPTLQTLVSFSYPNASDNVKSVTVDLAPGVLANPTVVNECTQADFNNDACASDSQIGAGSATANASDANGDGGGGTVTIPVKLFLIQQPAGDTSALAQVGLVAYLDGQPEVTQQSGAALSLDPNHQGSAELTFNSIPSQVTIGASTVNVQVTSISLSIFPTVNGKPFTIQTSNCTNSSVTSITATDTASATTNNTSEFTATGCPTQEADPSGHNAPVSTPATQGANGPDATGQFQLNPDDTSAGGNPNLSTIFDFNYADSSQGKLGGSNTNEPTSELYLPTGSAQFKWSSTTNPTTLTLASGTIPADIGVGDAIFGATGVPSGTKVTGFTSSTVSISRSVTNTKTTGTALTIVTSPVAAASTACSPSGTSASVFDYVCHVANSATTDIYPSFNTNQQDSGTAVCADMMMLTYSNSTPGTGSGNCAWIKSFSVELAAGVLANPSALKEYCPYEQWNTFSNAPNGATSTGPACPADTEIASGHAAANTYDDPADGNNGNQNSLITNLYLLPPDPADPTQLARVGATVTLSGVPVTGVLGTATLLPDGQVQLSFPSVPQAAFISGLLEYAQINRLALTVSRTVPRPVTTASVTGMVTPQSSTITGVSSLSGLTVGDHITGTDVPGNAVITSITPPSTITISANALGSGAALSDSLSVEQGHDITGTTTAGQPQVTDIADTSSLAAGDLVTGVGIPAATTIQSVDSSSQITLSTNATASGSTALDATPVALFTVNPPGCETAVSTATAMVQSDTLTNSLGQTEPATATVEPITVQSAFNPTGCTATDGGGRLGSPTAPSVTQSPSSTTVVSPNSATFSSLASGETAPAVQWQVSTDGGGTWTPDGDLHDSGAASPTLTVSAGSQWYQDGAEFEACFTNPTAGPVCSSPATLTVHQPSPFSASLALTPSTLAAGGNPTLTTNVNFTYPNSTDTVTSTTISLAPGLLANPAAVPTRCTSAQLTSYSCPSASVIGQGMVTANLHDRVGTPVPGVSGTDSLPVVLYLMPVSEDQTQVLAQVGLVAYFDGQGVVSVSGNATINDSGGVSLTFTNLPSQVTIGGAKPVTVAAQVTGISIQVNPQAGSPATRFTFNPSQCAPATSTMSATDTASTTANATSAFTPTGCANPSEQKVGSGDSGQGVQITSYSMLPDSQTVSTPTATAHPSLYTDMTLAYANPTDTIQNLTIALPPGVLANPAAVTSPCTLAQLNSPNQITLPNNSSDPNAGCPTASEIGSGWVQANARGAGNAPVDGTPLTGPINGQALLNTYVYLLRPSDCPTADGTAPPLACVGVLAALGPLPVQALVAPATLNDSGQAQITLTNVPKVVSVAGQTEAAQITAVHLTVNGETSDGHNFTIAPDGCDTVGSTVTASTYAGATVSAKSSFRPDAGFCGTPDETNTQWQPPASGNGRTFKIDTFHVQSVPTTTSATGNPEHPNVTTSASFEYANNATDWAANLVTLLPKGLLADPSVVATRCSPAQLASNSCPASSQVGSVAATVIVAGATSLDEVGGIYLMNGAPNEIARLGVTITSTSGSLIAAVEAPLTVTSNNNLVITLGGAGSDYPGGYPSTLPQKGVFGGVAQTMAIGGLTMTLNGGQGFLTSTSDCTSLLTSQMTATAIEGGAPVTLGASSSYTPTCGVPKTPTTVPLTSKVKSVTISKGTALVTVTCGSKPLCAGGSVVLNSTNGKGAKRLAIVRFRSLKFGDTKLKASLSALGKRTYTSTKVIVTTYTQLTIGGKIVSKNQKFRVRG